MSVVYWRARAEQAEQKLKLCLRGIGLIGASAGLYNDANCPIPMVEIVTRVVDEIARLTRERDEARALVQHAYLTAWAARHNHFKATPPDMRKGWRAFALAHGLPLDPNPADAAEAPE